MKQIAYTIPCTFAQGETKKGGNVPMTLKARTADPIKFYGYKLVHDFAGMSHKPKIGIDLQHDPERMVGYGDDIKVEDNVLMIKGAYTPVDSSPYIQDMLDKMAAGVPYEASIHTSFEEKDVIFHESGQVVANGRTYEAPVILFSKWALRACAVCARGADGETESLQLAMSDGDIESFKQFVDDRKAGGEPRTAVRSEVPDAATEPEAEESNMAAAQTEAPETPEVPEVPDTQSEPEVPEVASNPEAPETPEVPDEQSEQEHAVPSALDAKLDALMASFAELKESVASLEEKFSGKRLPGGQPTQHNEPGSSKFASVWAKPIA